MKKPAFRQRDAGGVTIRWLIRQCFVDNFKVAVFGHAVGQKLGRFEMVQTIDGADGFAVIVADINNA